MSVASRAVSADNGSTAEQPAISYYASSVWASDLDTLNDGAWLNDNVITLWQEVLAHDIFEARHDFSFMHPSACFLVRFLSQEDIEEALRGLELSKKVLVFVPLNDNENPEKAAAGSHWSVLVWNRRDGQFHHFDSGEGRNAGVAESTSRALYPILTGKKKSIPTVLHHKTPQQTNSYDCGVYAMCITNAVAMNDGPVDLRSIVTPATVADYRCRMRAVADSLRVSQRQLGGQKKGPEDER